MTDDTQHTEGSGRNPLLLLLLCLLLALRQGYTVGAGADCFRQTHHEDLTCDTDYNRSITCVWNATDASDHAGDLCTLAAKSDKRNPYSSACDLQPVNGSSPGLRKCSMEFKRDFIFVSFHKLSIVLTCTPAKQILKMSYRPVCHVKLNPPGRPVVNDTTVSWSPQVKMHQRISVYICQLQWRRWDQSWSDPSVQKMQTKTTTCKVNSCEAQLNSDLLAPGERHEARTRVQSGFQYGMSTWSDWGPTASWVSPGSAITKPPPPPPLSEFGGGQLGMIIAGTGLALGLAVMLFRNDKVTWVYEKMRGPDPGKSFLKDANFENWLSPHYTSQSFHSSLKLEDVVSVEVTSSLNAVILHGTEAALLEKMSGDSSYESTKSSFSNPSYAKLCPPPPPPPLPPPPPPLDSLPTTGNLKPHANDPPLGRQGEGKNAVEGRDEERMKELEILQLLSRGSGNSEPVQVISDYEKVEKLPVQELLWLQNEDLGMCIGEEVSQESLEADSIIADGSHDEGAECEDEEEGGKDDKVNFLKLFGGSGSVFGKGSIQVCSDYEQVPRLQPGSPELPSLDSGVSSGGEEQVSHEESLEDIERSTESTSFLFPPPPSCASQCFVRSFPQPQPTKFCGTGLSPALLPPSRSPTAGRIALMAVSRSMEPSGDGYMPVRKEPR